MATSLINGKEHRDRRPFFGYMFQKDLSVSLAHDTATTSRSAWRSRGSPGERPGKGPPRFSKRFGLIRFADKYPAQLSGGMRQRAALMRTLLCDREFLLLDEPFGALDALTRSIMQEWLLGIWESDHRTIVFITHDIEEAVFLSDRVLLMSAHPGHVKTELVVDLGRPRDHTVVTSPRFAQLKKILLDNIYEESLKAQSEIG